MTDEWSLKGSASLVDTECLDLDEVPGCAGLLDVSMNAPKRKGLPQRPLSRCGIAGTSVSLTAYNVLDKEHRKFVGTPELGRLVLPRLTYQVR